MAAVGSLDLPDLPKLFAGDERILSWTTCSIFAVSEVEVETQSFGDDDVPIDVFRAQHVREIIHQTTPAFSDKDAFSARRFQTATAAIHVPPTTDKHYDIQQIRSDAEWLASSLKINEVQALRVALLEWQNRPQLHLNAGYSEAEIASLRDVYGSRLAFDVDFEVEVLRPRDEDDFSTDTARRRRQVFIHFQECVGLTRAWLVLQQPSVFRRWMGEDKSGQTEAATSAMLDQCIDLLIQQISAYAEGPDERRWHVIDQDTNYIWQVGHVHYVQALMQVIVHTTRQLPTVPREAVKNWMGIMADVQFLRHVEPGPLLLQPQLDEFHSLVSITTLALIDPANTTDKLKPRNQQPQEHWMQDGDLCSEVHQILFNAIDQSCIQAVPAAFAWALVLREVESNAVEAQNRGGVDIGTYDSASGRRASMAGSAEETMSERILSAIQTVSPVANPSGFLLEHTLDTYRVADMLASLAATPAISLLPSVHESALKFLQELVATASHALPDGEAYGENVLSPQFAILTPAKTERPESFAFVESCRTFVGTAALTENILDVAAARFPYEALPFLRLCRLLARADVFDNTTQYITYRLGNLQSFTQRAVGPFATFHTIREDENLNLVSLDEHVFAFPRASMNLLTQAPERQQGMILPAGTVGETISDTHPPVVKWSYEYSALPVIGEWLELHYNALLYEVLANHENSSDVATELILLLANLVAATYKHNTPESRNNAVDFILNESSAHLSFGSSITNLIFDIIEQELQAYRQRPSNTFGTSVLGAAITYASTVLKVKPALFWQQMSKTSIVNAHGGSSLLFSVISGVESVSRNASIAEISAQLYCDMIPAAVQRFADPAEGKQWRAKSSAIHHSNDRIYENALTSMTQTMLDVFESLQQWKPLSPPQESRIITALCNSFSKLLKYKHGIGSPTSRATACFDSAADLILTKLRPEAVGDARSGSIAAHLLAEVCLVESLTSTTSNALRQRALFKLSNTLVTAAQAQLLPAIGLELCLFDLVPVLIRNSHAATPMLLESLLKTVSSHKPVSLLGHLGSSSCIDFVNLLSKQASNRTTAAAAWRLLALLVSKDQQWLSVVLLTGSVPDKTGRTPSKESSVYRGSLVIEKALHAVADIDVLERHRPDLVKSILTFIIVAQQNWYWALASLRSRQDVFSNLMQYAQIPAEQSQVSDAKRKMIIALIVDLCSVHLQYAKSVGDLTLLRSFLPLVQWLTSNAIEISSYNTSMHTNLNKNLLLAFEFDLNDFKNNHKMMSEDEDFYNLDVADLVLGPNPTWEAQGKFRGKSYRDELIRANENLRVVGSELVLLNGFQKLCIEHAAFFAQNTIMQTTMADIAQRCLTANSKKYPAEQLFDHLVQTRCDIALAFVSRLVDQKVSGSVYRELSRTAWESAIFSNSSYEHALANNDLHYWRSSLTVVLLSFQFHLESRWQPLASKSPSAAELLKHKDTITPQILELATIVIGQGLSTVVQILQEQKQAQMQQHPVEPNEVGNGIKDITLILNILETILRMPRLPEFAGQLSERLIATDTIQSALKLYMWSHLLAGADTDNEPVHAELATRLLVSLSSLPAVAEEMAVEGVLSSILTARITQVLQKIPDGAGSLDQRPHASILYTIWAQGILPLALNLLHAVQGPIAAEISMFLNAFPEQLSRANTAFRLRPDAFITLSLSKELSTLSLLSFVLDDYRNAGASAAVDPASLLPLAGFDEHKRATLSDIRDHAELNKTQLRSKIVPTSEKEMVWHANGKTVLTDKVLKELEMAVVALTNSIGEEAQDDGEKGKEKRPPGHTVFD